MKSDSPPRVNSDVWLPRPPLAVTPRPGTVYRSASATVSNCLAAMSFPVTTVTLSVTRDRGSSRPDAVTTTDSPTALTCSETVMSRAAPGARSTVAGVAEKPSSATRIS